MTVNKLSRNSYLTDQTNVLNYTRVTENNTNQSITELTTLKPLYNNPYSKNSGAWRILNLRVNKQDGYGSATNGASLKFGFAAFSSANCSAICGFTFGIPPLYAEDMGTISKSIAYGFALNPFGRESGQNVVYIIHENSILNLGNIDTSNLTIQVKGAQVSYIVGTGTPRIFNMTATTAHLYVVGALGHQASEIVNLSLAGGEGFSISNFNIDYSKQIWVLCSGLDAQDNKEYPSSFPLRFISNPIVTTNSQIILKGVASTQYKVYYPWDEDPEIQTFPVTPVSIPGNINNIPFVVRIELLNGLSNLQELSLINTSPGASSTLKTNESHLTGLNSLEIRSNYKVNQLNEFFPLIGQQVYPANLTTLFLESAQEANIDITKLTKLTRLHYLCPYVSHPDIGAIPGLKILELNGRSDKFGIKSSLENFRNYFELDGLVALSFWRGRLQHTDIIELALAKSSRRLLYTDARTRLTGSSSRYAWEFEWDISNTGFRYRGALPWQSFSRNDTLQIDDNPYNLTNPVSLRILIRLTTSAGSVLDSETSSLLCVSNPPSGQEYLRYFSIRKIDSNYKIFRKIAGNTVKSFPNANQIDYAVTLEREKTDKEITGNLSNASSTSYGVFHTLTALNSLTAFNSIQVGDTVCLRNKFIGGLTNNQLPSIVVKKEIIDGNSVATILKGNIDDGIGDATGEDRLYHFCSEFRIGNKRPEVTVNTFATPVVNTNTYQITVPFAEINNGNIAIGSPVLFSTGATPDINSRPIVPIGQFNLQTSRVTAISGATVTVTKGLINDGFLTDVIEGAIISNRTPATGTGNFLFNYCYSSLINPVALDSTQFPGSGEARIYSGETSGHDYVFY